MKKKKILRETMRENVRMETFAERLERFEQTLYNLRVDVDELKNREGSEDWL